MTIEEIANKIEDMEDDLNESCPKGTPRGNILGECFFNIGIAFMMKSTDEEKAFELASKAYYTVIGLRETGMVEA
jgi:hypothetical protein